MIHCLTLFNIKQNIFYFQGVLSNAIAWSVLERQLEDSAFVDELQHICRKIESDGLIARNPGISGVNLSAFPQELMNVMNNPVNFESKPELDFDMLQATKANNEQLHNSYENCESVSFEMLARSFKAEVKNNIRNKVPKDISILSSILQNSRKPMKYEKALNFITYLLDITTHLAYYKKPVDPNLAVFVQAQFDGYMPNTECPSPQELWPGCGVEYVDSGHVFAALYKQDVFRKIIAETLERC